jgi:hypothetical protein
MPVALTEKELKAKKRETGVVEVSQVSARKR